MDIEKKIVELKDARAPYCVITVVRASGSVPRHAGSKMVVTAKETFGTIGGGSLEHKAIEDARELMPRRVSECRAYPLGPMLGQCCGGSVEVFFEPSAPKLPMYVFGAGHVSEALCPMLGEAGFDITLIDERPERITLPAFDCVRERWNELPSDIFKRLNFSDETNIIVLTHQHKHDEEIVRFCLDKPFRYLGCIGSRTKWEKFKARYRAQGLPDGQLTRVSTPIGFDIGAETPFEIAVAIVAELIQLKARPEDFKSGVGRLKK